jgi:hypothetical protein
VQRENLPLSRMMKILDGQSLIAERGLDYFKAGSTFGALSDEAIRFLLTRGRIASLADGEEMDDAEGFFIVLQGQLDCFRVRGNEEVPLLSVTFGEQIGYVSMIGLFRRLGSGRAHGPTTLLNVSPDLFYQLHEELPFDFGILMLNLSREMARAFRKVTEDLVDACSGHHIL